MTVETVEVVEIEDEVEVLGLVVDSSGGGSSAVVVHDVLTPSASWIYIHGFGRVPIVSVYVGGLLYVADVVATTTTVTVTFATAKAGQLVLT